MRRTSSPSPSAVRRAAVNPSPSTQRKSPRFDTASTRSPTRRSKNDSVASTPATARKRSRADLENIVIESSQSTPKSQKRKQQASTSKMSSSSPRRRTRDNPDHSPKSVPPTPEQLRLKAAVQTSDHAQSGNRKSPLPGSAVNTPGSGLREPSSRYPSRLATPVSVSSKRTRRSASDASDDATSSPRRKAQAFTVQQFDQWLNREVDKEFDGWGSLERSKQVTDGNTKLEAKHLESSAACQLALKTMTKAQYGRAKSSFVRQAMDAAGITKYDKFADIGSGIGTVVLQVAATIGCASCTGVELCRGRHEIALELQKRFTSWVESCGKPELAENVTFFTGDFREPENFARCRDADVLFVNNAESIFGMRSVANGSYTLDWHVARLACGMRVGSRIVTFEALTDLEHAHFAPCFERREFLSERGATSWTEVSMKPTRFFCYRKIGDSWQCSRCTFENSLLRPSRSQWGESMCDTCAQCEADPAGHRRAYSMRNRKGKSSQSSQ